MPVLSTIGDELTRSGILIGRRIGVALSLEPKTATFALTLHEAGAEVVVVSGAESTKDDVAAALAHEGVGVLARSDASAADERGFALQLLDEELDVLVDDGSEIIRFAHAERSKALTRMIGAAEETTSGLRPLRAMENAGELAIPCIAVNDARSKYLFDNLYGTGQSCVMAALDITNLQLAGKVCVVAGYGWVGQGIARYAWALGARVVVTEVDPMQALRAHHDGFAVARLLDTCPIADLVFSATGVAHTITLEHLAAMKDGALIAVGGGVAEEISVGDLKATTTIVDEVRPNVTRYTLADRTVNILADGECVNLAAGEGNPIEIMDMSLAVQGRAVEYLLTHGTSMSPGVHLLPEELDDWVASTALQTRGIQIDEPSIRQQEFLTATANKMSVSLVLQR
jgi:adenosylhomocysteinase